MTNNQSLEVNINMNNSETVEKKVKTKTEMSSIRISKNTLRTITCLKLSLEMKTVEDLIVHVLRDTVANLEEKQFDKFKKLNEVL